MGWPQYTALALNFVGIGLALARHGQPETGRHNFFTTTIAAALWIGLLYAGGFFNG